MEPRKSPQDENEHKSQVTVYLFNFDSKVSLSFTGLEEELFLKSFGCKLFGEETQPGAIQGSKGFQRGLARLHFCIWIFEKSSLKGV